MGEIDRHEARYVDLIRRNQPRIVRLARAWTRSPGDAEDLRSEILLQLWRSLPSFDGRSSEDTWLYRVALNTAMLFGRREGHRKARLEAFERDAPAVEEPPTPEEELDRRARLEALEQALAALSPADRAVMLLLLEGLPHAEIADVTGLSVNNVGVRLHRAKQRLAKLLVPEEARDATT